MCSSFSLRNRNLENQDTKYIKEITLTKSIKEKKCHRNEQNQTNAITQKTKNKDLQIEYNKSFLK